MLKPRFQKTDMMREGEILAELLPGMEQDVRDIENEIRSTEDFLQDAKNIYPHSGSKAQTRIGIANLTESWAALKQQRRDLQKDIIRARQHLARTQKRGMR
jgi:predicted  nucleic acid-binding Zn-ribbon protein